MDATLPAVLDSAALSRRLAELAGDERQLLVDFILHLDEYDRRRAFVEAGYATLWEFLTSALHYREGAAYRRMTAMKALRRVPALADALRDGRLCLTTLALLEEVLTPEEASDILARCAFQSKRQVECIVAALRPRSAPKDGVRRVVARGPSAPAALPLASPVESVAAPAAPEPAPAPAPASARTVGPPLPSPVETRATVHPVSAEAYSLRVTIDAELKADLDELRALLSHKVPDGDLHTLLREAVRCAIEKHGKRKGAVEPARKRKAAVAAAATSRREPSLEVRRQVWKRDGGQCAWVGPDGRRCESQWQLEYDHVHPAALGGAATVENGRLLCRPHQQLSAEQTLVGRTWRSSAGGPGRVNPLLLGEVQGRKPGSRFCSIPGSQRDAVAQAAPESSALWRWPLEAAQRPARSGRRRAVGVTRLARGEGTQRWLHRARRPGLYNVLRPALQASLARIVDEYCAPIVIAARLGPRLETRSIREEGQGLAVRLHAGGRAWVLRYADGHVAKRNDFHRYLLVLGVECLGAGGLSRVIPRHLQAVPHEPDRIFPRRPGAGHSLPGAGFSGRRGAPRTLGTAAGEECSGNANNE
jgi:hypothetical protein